MIIKNKLLKIFKNSPSCFKFNTVQENVILNTDWRKSKSIQLKISLAELPIEISYKVQEFKLNVNSTASHDLIENFHLKDSNSVSLYRFFKIKV